MNRNSTVVSTESLGLVHAVSTPKIDENGLMSFGFVLQSLDNKFIRVFCCETDHHDFFTKAEATNAVVSLNCQILGNYLTLPIDSQPSVIVDQKVERKTCEINSEPKQERHFSVVHSSQKIK